MTEKTINKPVPKAQPDAYDWSEIVTYIFEKYGKNIRDWAKKYNDVGNNTEIPYQDFWHWIHDNFYIHNGCYVYINTKPENYRAELKPWVCEILTLLDKEFPEANGELRCWVEW